MSSIDEVSRRLGHVESTTEGMEKRLDKIDTKLDALVGLGSVIEHMKNNISMMKQPVEDYQRVKDRGMGMWTLFVFLLGGLTVVFNIGSYIIRTYILKI